MGCGASSSSSSSQHPVESTDVLASRLKNGNANDRRTAAIELASKSRQEASPYFKDLADALLDPDLEVRNRAGKSLVSLSKKGSEPVTELPDAVRIAEFLWHEDYQVRGTAQDTLEGLGPIAALALPQLTTALGKDGDACFRSLKVFSKLGPKANSSAPEIARCLECEEDQTCKAAEDVLIQLKEAAALSVLKELLAKENANIISRVMRVLEALGPAGGSIACDLVRLLSNQDEEIRNDARRLLQHLGENAGSAAPELVKLCHWSNKEPSQRLMAAKLLGCLGVSATEYTPVLVKMLRDRDDEVRKGAAESLIALADHAALAIPELAGLLNSQLGHDTEDTWLGALRVIGKLGRLAEPLAAAVAEGLGHDSMEVRDLTVEVLKVLGDLGCAEAAIPVVTRFMSNDSSSVRMSASNALKRLERSARSGAADVAKLLASDRYDVQRKALETLEELGPQAAGGAPDIAKLLAHDREDVRNCAVQAMNILGVHGVAGLVQLLALLTHRKEFARSKAADIIRGFGMDAVPEFNKIIAGNEDWKIRRRMVEQVGKLGADAAPFVPSIVELLGDESVELQIIVATFLRDLQTIPGVVPPDALQVATDLMKNLLQYHVPPPHWCNNSPEFDDMIYVDRKHHDKFNRLLQETYVSKCTQDRPCPKGMHGKTKGGCACVQPGGDPGLPVEYLVHRAVRVENALMWARYVSKRSAIRVKRVSEAEPFRHFDPPIMSCKAVDECPEIFAPLEHDLNEVYLFHGTFVRATLSIAKLDFNINLAGSSTGTMYGAGAYLGESVTKADEYAKDEPGGYYDGIYATLLCRACMGKLYYTTKRDTEAGDKVVGSGNFDSTCGDRSKSAGTFRELVVYDNDQLYPEYILFYKRVHSRDDKSKIFRELTCPLHLQTPVYWSNCYKDLGGDGFNERHAVSPVTFASLQKLVGACLTSSRYELISAHRVENSHLWKPFVDFKLKLRQRGANCIPVQDLDSPAGAVLTAKHLEHENLEQTLSLENIETNINEYWLWHATSEEGAELILQNNFKFSKEIGSASTLRYGQGAYFAESLDKAAAYSMDDTKFILLCRVACGGVYYTDQETENEATTTSQQCGLDSVLGDPSKQGPREFVAVKAEQIYPEFMLVVGKA